MWDPNNTPGCHDQLVLSWEPTWKNQSTSCQCWLSFFQVLEWWSKESHKSEMQTHGLGKTTNFHCYFRSSPIQRWYRKIMIEIWQECASFQTTSPKLADQVWTIIKKAWFSDLEILEIYQKKINKIVSNTISDSPSIDKQKQSNRNEPPTSKNINNTQPNNTEQTLTQEQKKKKLKCLKRIMNGKKTTLPSLRNIEWRTVKTETGKINQVLTYIYINK